MPTPEARVPIALLSQTGEASRHLREALAGAGAPIVYEAHAAQLDRDALEQSGARVVVVNLDADVDAHLDDVYALLGDDRYNVIFNESQVSAQLSGWEQARWARHLASKILGTASADPPRPEGARPVPPRVPAARMAEPVEAPPAQHAAGAGPGESTVCVTAAPAVGPHAGLDLSGFDAPAPPSSANDEAHDFRAAAPPPPTIANDENYDFRAADSLLEQAGLAAMVDHAAEFAARSEPVAIDVPAFPTPVFDSPVIEDATQPLSSTAVDFGTEYAEPMVADAEAVIHTDDAGEGDALGFGDLDDFAGSVDPDAGFAASATDAPSFTSGEESLSFEIAFDDALDPASSDVARADAADPAQDFAASAEAIEQASEPTTLSDLELLDLDWADAPKPLESAQDSPIAVPPPPPVSHAAFAWTLADTDETDAESDATPATGTPTSPNEFGIETITASEFLAPAVDLPAVPVPSPSLSALSLELVPLEEAVAPQVGAAETTAVRETWLDTSAFGSSSVVVRKVWVLGASIGGPEAVREFLARIPKDYPALFLLAQHMGPDFMELMAQQLVRTTALTVRTPTHGERVAHGDIVVVPITHRLRVDAQGVIMLEPIAETQAAHSPSIDQVLRDVADRFGAKAGAIIFSGMAEDAAEGSRYLADKGGKVFVQDPQTCVISSMVDGVLETGVVAFTGSPHELADRVLGERSKSATTSQER